MKALIASLFAALLFAVAAPAAQAQATDPAITTVQNFYDALLDSMKAGKAAGEWQIVNTESGPGEGSIAPWYRRRGAAHS